MQQQYLTHYVGTVSSAIFFFGSSSSSSSSSGSTHYLLVACVCDHDFSFQSSNIQSLLPESWFLINGVDWDKSRP